MQDLIHEVKNQIAEGETKKAIALLESIMPALISEKQNEFYNIKSAYYKLSKDFNHGIVSNNDQNKLSNKIVVGLLEFLDKLEIRENQGITKIDSEEKLNFKELISENKTQRVIDILLDSKDILHPRIYDRIIEISNRFNSVNRDKNLGLVSYNDYTLNSNRINLDLLRILDVLDNQDFIESLSGSNVNEHLQDENEGFLDVPDIPEDLLVAIENGDCVLYSGAGLSARAGLPIWSRFVGELVKWAKDESIIGSEESDSLLFALEDNEINLVADSIISAVNRSEKRDLFLDYLKFTFWKENLEIPDSHEILAGIDFNAVMSTNFDLLLEFTFKNREAKVLCPQDSEELFEHFSRDSFYILKLYGSLDRPDTVLVSPNQYEEAMSDNLPFSEFMESVLVRKTILFLGSSQDGIEAYFGGLKFRKNAEMKRHYALVDVYGKAWKAKANMLERRFGIKVLPYNPTPEFPETHQFLLNLQSKLNSRKEQAFAIEEGEATEKGLNIKGKHSWIKRIILEDIGPFENLDLDLDSKWNIILGDNGVGKSTVLRAIAVGITGEDATPYADRLIRTGRTSGRINLIMSSGKEYITTIKKKGSGGAQVKTIPGLFMQTENFLTLGFPAVRTVNWAPIDRSKYKEGANRPMANDVLPIITGEADPRMNQLKEWIFDLDHQMKTENSAFDSADYSHEKLLHEFFKIVGEITVGMKLEFNGIDFQTKRVMITTDDGDIPLESVSQGTASLLGWIGVLLQRLFEIYNFKDKPREKYALVLMDEIDAHMHPEWQQKIQPLLARIFPNVQFVATTHSPLVVGGMKVSQVMRFARDENKKIHRMKLEEGATMGRANQLLTSELFGLDSTLDLKDETVNTLERYKELYAKDSRTPEEEEEYMQVRAELKFRIPPPTDTKAEERALSLLQSILEEQIGNKMPEVTEKVIDRARSLFDSFANSPKKKS